MAPVVRYDLQWARTNVRPQRQAGFAVVTVTIPLGDLTGAQLRILGDLALAYGDGTVRTTVRQGLLFRWVRAQDVPELYRRRSPHEPRGRPRPTRRRSNSLDPYPSCPQRAPTLSPAGIPSTSLLRLPGFDKGRKG